MLAAVTFASLLVGSEAFAPLSSRPSDFSLAAAKKSAPQEKVLAFGSSRVSVPSDRSEALPFDVPPRNIDPSLPGYAGFDPFGFANAISPSRNGAPDTFKWYRESEIVHGRVAQLAVVGSFFPAFYHFPTNGIYPEGSFSELNQIKALYTVPPEAIGQILVTIAAIEAFRTQRTLIGNKEPGDLGLGQVGGWNPFNFKYTEEEYFEKQVQEIKHGRLAMLGAAGLLFQNANSGVGITEQLGSAFSVPDAREVMTGGPGVLGDYFPPGL